MSDGERIGAMVTAIEKDRDAFAQSLYAILMADKAKDFEVLERELAAARQLILETAPACLSRKVQ